MRARKRKGGRDDVVDDGCEYEHNGLGVYNLALTA